MTAFSRQLTWILVNCLSLGISFAQTTFTMFDASRHMYSGIQISGQLSENQTGVRILRSSSNDRATAAAASPVIPLTSPDPRYFRWQDPTASANQDYHYWVQALSSHGAVVAEAGPVVGKRPIDVIDLANWEQVAPTPELDFGNHRLRLLNHAGYLYLYGANNSLRRSSNGGTTWENFTTGSTPFHQLVGGDGGVLHAVNRTTGIGGTVWRSTDHGATWAQTPMSNFPGATAGIAELVFGGGRWLAHGSGVVYTSVNSGVTWISHGVKINASQTFHNMIYAQNRFVACSALDDGFVHYSSDGNTWTTVDPDPSWKQYLEWVIYTGTEYIAASGSLASIPNGQSQGQKIYRSTNLTTWTATAITPGQARVFSSARPQLLNGRFYGTRSGKQLVRTANTSDLSNWEIVDDNAYTSIVNTGTRLLAAGQGGFLAESATGQIWTGITAPTNQNLKQVIRGPGGWVALPESGAPLFSSNGRDWQRVATLPTTRHIDWHSAVASDGRYVLHGSYTYVPIYYPTNAQGSTVYTFPIQQHVTETFFVSQNGTTWTEKTNVQDAQGAMRSVDGNLFQVDNTFLAKSRVDGTKLIRSGDGLNWQTISTGFGATSSSSEILSVFRQGENLFMSGYTGGNFFGEPLAFVHRSNQLDGTWSRLFGNVFPPTTYMKGAVRSWGGKLWNIYHPNLTAPASLRVLSSNDGQTWASAAYSGALIQPQGIPHWCETARSGTYAFRHTGTASVALTTDVLFVSAGQTGQAWYPQTVSTGVAMTSIAGSPDESAVMVAEGGRILFATLPDITTASFLFIGASNLGTTVATLNAQVINDESLPITERGFVYAPTAVNADPVLGGDGVTSITSADTTESFRVALNGLTFNTSYSFKAYATNSIGTAYSTLANFSTLASPPVNIADAKLETAIRTALSKPTGPITEADMLTLTNLNLSGLGLTNLSGLEFAENLRIINMRGNAFADVVATWSILDQLPLYCLYADIPRPGGNSPVRITQAVTDTSGGIFYIVVDAPNLPTLDISGLGIDTSNQANLAALQVFSAAGVTVETSGTNLPPLAIALATILNAATSSVSLNGSASSDIDGNIASWAWSWSGGSATGANPTVTLPVGETTVTLTVTDDDGASSGTTVTVSIVTLASAMQDSGLTGNDALPDATPFNDGVANLLKYAFNMNLAGPDVSTLSPGTGNSGLPAITTPEDAPAGTLRFEFLRRKGSGLVYAPRKSTTLDGASWAPLAAAPVVTSINDQWERVVYTEAPDPVSAPACFGRVEVTIP